MLPFKLVYHSGYDLNLGQHVFPSQKFRLIAEKLVEEGIAEGADFLQPEAADDEALLRVHTRDWVEKLRTGTLTLSEIMKLEVPYSPELARAVWLAAGGSILAAQGAMRDGFGSNIGGGFHHAFAGYGEGFCPMNDVAVAIRTMQAAGAIRRAMVIDTDVHQGNGTAGIFANDESVFTLSIHQLNNYPAYKPPSSLDINLADGADDEEYLGALIPDVQKSLDDFQPELVMYVGGADPYKDDQLGGLTLSIAGLKQRDESVFEEVRRRGIPVATVLAGGYARKLEDTLRIHVNTIVAAANVAKRYPANKSWAAL